MEMLLPNVVAVLALVALFAALFALWRSLRGALGADAEAARPGAAHSAAQAARRIALLEEKEGLLQALSDLAFDRDSGKVSEEDFRVSERRLRARAKEVMRSLDEDVEVHRGAAEALVTERLRKLAGTPGGGADAPGSADASPGDAGRGDGAGA